MRLSAEAAAALTHRRPPPRMQLRYLKRTWPQLYLAITRLACMHLGSTSEKVGLVILRCAHFAVDLSFGNG